MNDSLISALAIKCEKCEKEIPYTGYFFQKSFKVIDEIIQDLTQQLTKHNKEVHSTSNNNQLKQEICVLNQIIKNNQNQVQGLKQKLTDRINQESYSTAAKKEFQESIKFLEQNLPKVQTCLQNKLDKKQNQVSSQDKTNQLTNSKTQSNPDKFDWKWTVVLSMGGVIVLLLGIIVFQNWKKNQK